jgi:hypothetical protein
MKSRLWGGSLALGLLGACGGHTSLADNDAGDNAGAVDGAVVNLGAPWSPECPIAEPGIGMPCGVTNLECQYGSDPRADCNPVEACQGNGKWGQGTPANYCSPGANSSECPGSWSSTPRGQYCANSGLNCLYPEGTCVCERVIGDDAGSGPAWWCDDPSPSSCPVPYPRIGGWCDAGTTVCTYRACVLAISCQQGMWQEAAAACGG